MIKKYQVHYADDSVLVIVASSDEEALNASNSAYDNIVNYAYTHLGWRRRNVDGYTITPPVIDNAEYLKDAEFSRLVAKMKELHTEYLRKLALVGSACP